MTPETDTWTAALLAGLAGLVAAWAGATLMMWAEPMHGEPTLAHVLVTQAQFVWRLLHRIV